MSARTWATSSLLFPLHERIKGHDSVAMRRELERTQWLPASEILALRDRLLGGFLQRIGRTVPHYRDLFARLGVDPAGDRPMDVLQSLPLLTKGDVRPDPDRFIAQDHGKLTRYNTGGSSGEPLVFYMGLGRKTHDVAAKWRATRWWGVDLGDRELVVWGSPIELGAQDRVRRLRDALFASRLLPAFEMSPERLDAFVAEIRRYRPAMLFGYPSSLALIAEHAERRGVRLDDVGVRVVFVTSERLYEHQRARIEQLYGAPVANGYGARDAGFIAHQCPEGGMHISAEHIVVETVRPDGSAAAPGEAGEIVVTHLCTGDFPFVRYRTGDVGVLGHERCRCGRGLPLLQEVQGRTTDFIVAADGTVMHGLALIYPLREVKGIERFKVEQFTLEHTRVLIVPNAAFSDADEAKIVRDFKARLGANVRIDIERVDTLANEASGKFRYVVSRVAGGGPGAHGAQSTGSR